MSTSPHLQEFRCPVCGDVKTSFFPLTHKHDGAWVKWEPASAPEPTRRGPGRPRKVTEE